MIEKMEKTLPRLKREIENLEWLKNVKRKAL